MGVDQSPAGSRYRGQVLKAGAPFTLTTERYVLTGIVLERRARSVERIHDDRDRGRGDAIRRAGWIADRSRIAAIADSVVRRSAVSVRSSRALAIARRNGSGNSSRCPADERTRCALIALTAALAGHVLLATMLPLPASPTVELTAGIFLGAGLVAAAAARSR